MTYIVESFGAPGCSVEPRTAEFDSLTEARAEARRRIRISRLTPARLGGCPEEDGMEAVEAWCEYTHRQDPYGHRSGAVGIWRRLNGERNYGEEK